MSSRTDNRIFVLPLLVAIGVNFRRAGEKKEMGHRYPQLGDWLGGWCAGEEKVT